MKRASGICGLLAIVVASGSCAAHQRPAVNPPAPPAVSPNTSPVNPRVLEERTGLASYYAQSFEGRRTASGVPFDSTALVAAHPTYPFGTIVRVTNVSNGRSVQVRIVDRGPAAAPAAAGIIIDVSPAAARALDFVEDGHAPVHLEVIRWGRQP
jgi:rare lipoprotein A